MEAAVAVIVRGHDVGAGATCSSNSQDEGRRVTEELHAPAETVKLIA